MTDADPKKSFLLRAWESYLKHRSKGHVRIAAGLIGLATAIVSTPILLSLLQVGGILTDAPWWGTLLFASFFALLGVVVFLWKDAEYRRTYQPQLVFTPVDGMLFRKAIQMVGDLVGRKVETVGFSPEELGSPLRGRELSSNNAKEALEQLRRLQKSNIVGPYEVVDDDPGSLTVRRLT
ncbi:MAG TPA: hypothetical protein VK968_09650 [Roseimicrobium sp.]|nr:hypothetical protein [Roseimicrobium sp.]